MPQFKVIIIGGGLAGALLANGLSNNQIDWALYERDDEDTKREGYQIRLGDAAIKGLTSCLDKATLSQISRRLGQSMSKTLSAPTICNRRFQPVLDLSSIHMYSKSAAINRVVLRDLLLEPVANTGRVRFGKAFSHYEIESDDEGHETVVVHFADGSSDTCDVLVGADGSGSKVNKQVGANNLVDIRSHWAFVSKGSLPVERIRELPQRLLKGPIITLTNGVTFFYSLYLPAPSDPTGKDSSASGIAIDEDQASFYWGLNVPRDRYPFNSAMEIPDRLKFCLEVVGDWAPEYRQMISFGARCDEANEVASLSLRASNKLPKSWRENARSRNDSSKATGHPRVWLMGDAIHAMQPNRGMGGNQAMLDCADILPELLKLSTIAKSQPLATEQVQIMGDLYEHRMIGRAFSWVTKSGGTTVPYWDLDGILGTFIRVLGMCILPLISFLYTW
ncbi:FAD/NAD(P)-binding domain-containing protein, partial [Colletotrichum scovillei]